MPNQFLLSDNPAKERLCGMCAGFHYTEIKWTGKDTVEIRTQCVKR